MQNPQAWSCFGKLWADDRPECQGGVDVGYQGPAGTRVRLPCSAREECQHLTRSPVTNYNGRFSPYPLPPPTPTNHLPQYVPPTTMFGGHALPQAPTPTTHQLVSPYQAQHGPQHVAMPHQQPGAGMTYYLTVPEPYDPNVPWYKRLGAELFRSLLKAAGHTFAAHFDHNPVRAHVQPRVITVDGEEAPDKTSKK